MIINFFPPIALLPSPSTLFLLYLGPGFSFPIPGLEWLIPGVAQPAPPEWLVNSLKQLEKEYPNGDRFEATMKYTYLDPVTEVVINGQNPMPEGALTVWLPRIRCLDCLSKLYTPGPEFSAGKFEAHLKFSGHRDKVKARLAGQASSSGGGGGHAASGS